MKDIDPYPAQLRDVGEFGFIDHVRRRFGGPVYPGETGRGAGRAVGASRASS